MKKYLFMMALALMIGAGARAQEAAPRRDAPKEPPTVEQVAKRKADRMKQQLLLGEDQYDKVYKICLKQAEAQRKRMEEMRKERESVSKDLKGILNDAQYERYTRMQSRPAGDAMRRPGMHHGKCVCRCKGECPMADGGKMCRGGKMCKGSGMRPAPQRQKGPAIDVKGDPRRNMTVTREAAEE